MLKRILLLVVLALPALACGKNEPQPQPEPTYENAYPARLNLPVVRDDFGTLDLVWGKNDVADLLDASTGAKVGRLEMVSGAGGNSALFQILTDLKSGNVIVSFGGPDCRIAPGFRAQSAPFALSGKMETLDLEMPVALIRARISAAKGTKWYGAEFKSLKVECGGASVKCAPAKPGLLRFEPLDILFALDAQGLSAKTLKCTMDTYYGESAVEVNGFDVLPGTVGQIRLTALSDVWTASSSRACEQYLYSAEIGDSPRFCVRVGGVLQKVYPSTDYCVSSFGCDGRVTVEVTSSADITSFSVRPVNKGYQAVQLDSRTIAFEMEPYGRASVELNGSIDHPLFVFANPLSSVYEAEVAAAGGTVTRVNAGEVYRKSITMKSGNVLYVQGGGVVKGKIVCDGAKNVAVIGGGILDGWDDFSDPNGFKVRDCSGLRVSGITIISNTGRAFWTYNTSDFVYDNVKVLGTAAPSSDERQTDAMDLYSDHDGRIVRCFAFSNDDTYCIKTWKWSYKGESYNLSFEDCIAWNYRGNGFEIGYETGLDVHDITYKDIYSLRSSCGRAAASFRRGAVSIHAAASGTVYNVSYDGVYIEDPWEGGIDMRVLKSAYELGTGEVWGPGIIRDVTMKNVKMEKMPVEGQNFVGYDASHTISLRIDGLVIAGKEITTLSDGGFKMNQFVKVTGYGLAE